MSCISTQDGLPGQQDHVSSQANEHSQASTGRQPSSDPATTDETMSSYLAKMRSLPAEYKAALKSFAQSPSTFKVVKTTSAHSVNGNDNSPSATVPPDQLYVLDSSFNPPTRGHMDIALSALKADSTPSKRKHLLLLLATQNADKPSKPALFEQRLAMMNILADSLVDAFTEGLAEDPASSTADDPEPIFRQELTVHLGLTKHPYFIDKSYAIAGETSPSSSSSSPSSAPISNPNSNSDSSSPFPYPPTRQTHLIGHDTLTRLLDPKYYPPQHTLAPLAPLFANHSVRVTLRDNDGFGSSEEQRRYIDDLARGRRDGDGAQARWVEKIEVVEGINSGSAAGDGNGKGKGEGGEGDSEKSATSSTRAREAAKAGDKRTLVGMCGDAVAEWVLREGLYRE